MTVRATLAHGLFTVDPWDPSYGLAFGDELDSGAPPSSAQLDLDLEMPAGRWRPVNPDITASLPGALLFLDGVRRIDARIWVHGDAQPAPGIAASFAAGLVCCDSGARIAEVTIQRALFTAAAEAADIATRHGRYPARQAGASGPDPLSLALQRGLMEAEVDLAIRFRAAPGRRRFAHRRRAASRPHPAGTHGRLRQDPPRVLPAQAAGRRRRLTRARAAHPGIRNGNLVAPQCLVRSAAWRPRGALVWCGPARMLRGPATWAGHTTRRPYRPAPAAAGQRAAQGSSRPTEPRPHRRAGTRAEAQARRPAVALPRSSGGRRRLTRDVRFCRCRAPYACAPSRDTGSVISASFRHSLATS